MSNTKICAKCKAEKLVAQFSFRKGLRRNSYCRNCLKQMSFKYTIKRLYDLSVDDYELMLQQQNNSCAICQRQDIKLVVDHCHITKKVRGLLCDRCNMLLGQFNDSIEAFKRFISYLSQ